MFCCFLLSWRYLKTSYLLNVFTFSKLAINDICKLDSDMPEYLCGPLGSCEANATNVECTCMDGFEFKSHVSGKKPICVGENLSLNTWSCGLAKPKPLSTIGRLERMSFLIADIDECRGHFNHTCDTKKQVCKNYNGNYTCECAPCFVWDEDEKDCLSDYKYYLPTFITYLKWWLFLL